MTTTSPLVGRCLREFRIHKARIFDVDFNTTRIVSASEDNLICVLNFGWQGSTVRCLPRGHTMSCNA